MKILEPGIRVRTKRGPILGGIQRDIAIIQPQEIDPRHGYYVEKVDSVPPEMYVVKYEGQTEDNQIFYLYHYDILEVL